MSSSSNTFEHKNGISLTRKEVAQLENKNPQSLNSLPLVPAISFNLPISSPQNNKEETNKLYLSLSFSVLLIHCNPFIVILFSIKKKVVSEFCVQNFLILLIFF